MLGELAGFAQTSSFQTALARHTAADALDRFVKTAKRLDGPVNTSSAALALQELEILHGKMGAAALGTSKMQSLGTQLQREASKLQDLAKQQLQTLGLQRLLQAWFYIKLYGQL